MGGDDGAEKNWHQIFHASFFCSPPHTFILIWDPLQVQVGVFRRGRLIGSTANGVLAIESFTCPWYVPQTLPTAFMSAKLECIYPENLSRVYILHAHPRFSAATYPCPITWPKVSPAFIIELEQLGARNSKGAAESSLPLSAAGKPMSMACYVCHMQH